jgi:hypothetical protein
VNRDDFAEMRRAFAEKPVEELIRLLESDELRTRFLAEMCLRDATGT